MKLSMKSRYGLRALIDLSVNSKNEQVALGGIAERNNISPQYLEQVFASLRKAGIVKSIKGSQGGYFLNKPAEQITISEVIEALEGDYRIEAEDVPEDCDYKAAPEAIQKLVIVYICLVLFFQIIKCNACQYLLQFVIHLVYDQFLYCLRCCFIVTVFRHIFSLDSIITFQGFNHL